MLTPSSFFNLQILFDTVRMHTLEKNEVSLAYKLMSQTFRQVLNFARHEYRPVEVFKIKIRSLVQKLYRFEKYQFSNCSYLIASHCSYQLWSKLSCDTLPLMWLSPKTRTKILFSLFSKYIIENLYKSRKQDYFCN